jgi:aspartyl protease family protein
MMRNMVLLGLAIGVSVSIPLYFEAGAKQSQSWPGSGNEARPSLQSQSSGTQVASAGSTPSGRMVELAADARGHFLGKFKVNGRRVEALVDTGASAMAFNVSTARRLGINVQAGSMTATVNTANGMAKAAVVPVERVQIGRVSVENVEAIVLEDKALSTSLVGMSFLNRLKKFQVDQGRLLLVQ